MDIHMGISGNRPQTSTRPIVIPGSLTDSRPSAGTRTMGLNTASAGYSQHSYRHVPLRQQTPRTSPRHQALVQTTYVNMDLGLHSCLGPQHGPQTPTCPPVALQSMLVLQGVQSTKVNLFSSRSSVIAQTQGNPASGQQV